MTAPAGTFAKAVVRTNLDAKRQALRINIRELANYLEARTDDAWAGKLNETWNVRGSASGRLGQIVAQLSILAATTRPHRDSPLRGPRRRKEEEVP